MMQRHTVLSITKDVCECACQRIEIDLRGRRYVRTCAAITIYSFTTIHFRCLCLSWNAVHYLQTEIAQSK